MEPPPAQAAVAPVAAAAATPASGSPESESQPSRPSTISTDGTTPSPEPRSGMKTARFAMASTVRRARMSPSASGVKKPKLRLRMQPVAEIMPSNTPPDSEYDKSSVAHTDEDTDSISSMAPSMANSMSWRSGRARGNSCASIGKFTSASIIEECERWDAPLPVDPWCGRCAALRPYGTLPLRPDQLNIANVLRLREMDTDRKLGISRHRRSHVASRICEHSEGRGSPQPPAPPVSKIEEFAQHMQQTKDTMDINAQDLRHSMKDIHLCASPKASRFSVDQHDGEGTKLPRQVLRLLTIRQVGLLEQWTINHIKLQHIRGCAQAHISAPRHGRKHRIAAKHATVCQLLRRMKRGAGKLQPDQRKFLLTELNAIPFLCDIPLILLESFANHLQIQSYLAGSELYALGDKADGVYVLLQGEVEVLNANMTAFPKEAPAAINPEDVIHYDPHGHILLRPEPERIRSRTLVASVGLDPMITVLFAPVAAIETVSTHYGVLDQKDRNDLIPRFFAQTLRLPPERCLRHIECFQLECFDRAHVIHYAGHKPALSTARISLVIEGRVQLVQPQKRGIGKIVPQKSRPSGAIVAERGFLLGEAALFGEVYTHTAIVDCDTVKILSLRASDLLDRILCQPALLKRPPPPDPSNEEGAGDSADIKETVKRWMDRSKLSLRIASDADSLKSCEWKAVRQKALLPKPRAPHYDPSRPACPRSADGSGPSDMCYPRDYDILPQARRDHLAEQRGLEKPSSRTLSRSTPCSSNRTPDR